MSKQPSDPVTCSATFQIRTLGDIFNLPTVGQMERCLDEISRGMIQARLTENLLIATMEASGMTQTDQRAVEWPDVVEWKDDGDGTVETQFGDDFAVVTTKQNDQTQQPHRA